MGERTLIEALIDNRFTRPLRPSIDRFAVTTRLGLRAFEYIANRRSMRSRRILHGQSAYSCYNNTPASFADDSFHISFLGRPVKIPLSPESAGLDWNFALSILGHDVEVKRIYEIYLQLTPRRVFFDVGANFGGHTALFLAHGATVYSFEPLPQCHGYFRRLAKANDWHHQHWYQVALSSRKGESLIEYPRDAEWLATIIDVPEQSEGANFAVCSVPLLALDDLALDFSNALMKLDTEGHETHVLRGCSKADLSNLFGIVFESNTASDRPALFAWACGHNFEVLKLSMGSPEKCTYRTFQESSATNFFMGPGAACEVIVRKWSECPA